MRIVLEMLKINKINFFLMDHGWCMVGLARGNVRYKTTLKNEDEGTKKFVKGLFYTH